MGRIFTSDRSPQVKSQPDDLLPLSPIAFEALMTLAEGEAHGYQIMLAVEERTGEPVHPGTLYRTLARLMEQDVVRESRPRAADADERRRYFQLTPFGRRVAEAEARRLARQVRGARLRRLLTDGDV
ncbi:MAG: helix-turn-helix transcriptional regulator [Vicinamibacterales bacterium]